MEARRDQALDGAIGEVMTHAPRSVSSGTLLREAVALLAEFRISELPVVDRLGRPLGLLDVTDIIGLIDLPASIPCPTTGNWPNPSA